MQVSNLEQAVTRVRIAFQLLKKKKEPIIAYYLETGNDDDDKAWQKTVCKQGLPTLYIYRASPRTSERKYRVDFTAVLWAAIPQTPETEAWVNIDSTYWQFCGAFTEFVGVRLGERRLGGGLWPISFCFSYSTIPHIE